MRLIKRIDTDSQKTATGINLRGYLISFLMMAVIATISVVFINWHIIKSEIALQIKQAGFQLQIVEINGRNHTTKEALKDALDLQTGTPIFAINIAEKQSYIEQLGWVEKAYIERILPDTLRITLIERTPIALLQTEQGHKLINENGTIIAGAAPEAFSHLPVVSGNKAASRAYHLIEILKTEPELYAEIWAIHHISNRRWDVHLKNGIKIKLPENAPGVAWSKLARLEHKNEIIQRDLAVIDLRLQNQILVEPNLPIRSKGQQT